MVALSLHAPTYLELSPSLRLIAAHHGLPHRSRHPLPTKGHWASPPVAAPRHPQGCRGLCGTLRFGMTRKKVYMTAVECRVSRRRVFPRREVDFMVQMSNPAHHATPRHLQHPGRVPMSGLLAAKVEAFGFGPTILSSLTTVQPDSRKAATHTRFPNGPIEREAHGRAHATSLTLVDRTHLSLG